MESTTAREIQWCVSVIHHAALAARRKYDRWERDLLTLNSFSDGQECEFVDFIPCPHSGQVFDEIELELILHTLPERQYLVIHDLFDGYSQKQIAEHLDISQQEVSRLRKRAINTLRGRMMLQ